MRAAFALLFFCRTYAADLRYWVEPCTRPEIGCRTADTELARWAMDAWQAASAGKLSLERTSDIMRAQIRFHWAGAEEGLYGEARPIVVDGRSGAEVYIRPAIVPPDFPDELMRDSIVYLSCLHESGHALGLPHTAAFADIMYSFQYGGDLQEYFARYRRKLSTRADIRKNPGMSDQDRARLRALYR